MWTQSDRQKVITSIRKLVPKKHINVLNPDQDYRQWLAFVDSQSRDLLEMERSEDFEAGVRTLLAALGSSHTAFFRESDHIPAPHAINATMRPVATGDGKRWMFVDVIEDGPAHRGGIRPGELLIGADGQPISPPEQVNFCVGTKFELEILGLDGELHTSTVEVPNRAAKDRPPMIEPRSLSHRVLTPHVGLIKVASFPGAVGLTFARSLDAAIEDLKQQGCNRLIVDIRGNVGGGLGSLRLMSYLCDGKLPVGHSLTRYRLRKGYQKDKLARISKIPRTKTELFMMAVRFKVFQRDRSMVLETEGLGPQPFHGRIVVLINEFTHSAAEMVASFAAENRFATLVGTQTAGEVLGGANFRLVNGYRLRMPVAGWYTWQGRCIEGRGVEPDVEVELSCDSLAAGVDNQLARAIEVVQLL
jgi:C-terminal processing protease CtpA/Prc